MVLLKPAEPNVGEQLASMPLGDIERMAENARVVEQDCEIREMIDAKALLKQLNRDRSKRGEPQLTLKDYLARRER
jgi:ribonucleotide reductase alpha subunit